MSAEIIHHGAKQGVTGSCHEFFMAANASVLIDCGIFQGPDALEASQSIDFSLDNVQALIITHCHIDHVGRLPALLAEGFRGPIYCTPATASLLPLVLEDAMKVSNQSESTTAITLKLMQQQLQALPLEQWLPLWQQPNGQQGYRMRLRNAGHIMGSAYVEFESLYAKNTNGLPHRVVFSGDLGCKNTPLLPDPTPLEYADTLVLESTYGDRNHEARETRQQRLQKVIEHCIADRGTVLIPAFSIGRTQELLYELEDIIHQCRGRALVDDVAWRDMVVILDSPMAAQFTKQYRAMRDLWDAEARQRLADDRHPLNFDRLHVVESHAEHERIIGYLRETGAPCIVIAASGMCTGGRMLNYLNALLPDPSTDVVFVGYQAQGTPGRDIQQYGPRGGYVMLDRTRVDIRAQVHTLGGYSAHADQRELIEFVQNATHIGEIRLVHGDHRAKTTLATALTKAGYRTSIG